MRQPHPRRKKAVTLDIRKRCLLIPHLIERILLQQCRIDLKRFHRYNIGAQRDLAVRHGLIGDLRTRSDRLRCFHTGLVVKSKSKVAVPEPAG